MNPIYESDFNAEDHMKKSYKYFKSTNYVNVSISDHFQCQI